MSASSSQNSAPPRNENAIVNIAAYKFVALSQLDTRRDTLKQLADSLELRGTILLSPEGVNLFMAGRRNAVDIFLTELRQDPLFCDISVKESLSERQPFNRMLVKIKEEIIAFGVDGIDPITHSSPRLPAAELKRWLDEGRNVHLLDTRNNYEVEIGTFENAIPADVDHFRDFPNAVERLPEDMKNEPVVMFCTGGIRCEKAGPFLERAGFQQVYQLEGGILKYFEECGADHFEGDCFVFDQRVAVDPRLKETDFTQCYVCQEVVSPEDQQSALYVPGVSCPRCYRDPSQNLVECLNARQAQLEQVINPLPGSQPYFNRRPLNVPKRFDGFRLIDFLSEWHPQIERGTWLQKIFKGEIVPGGRYGRRRRRKKSPEESVPLSTDRVVRGGERFEHLLPGATEPDVNAAIRILFEDDQFIVVNKPAPLPVHASGRFHRNTLQYILDEVYRPERPLIAHRLDANTSGVVVFCRRRSVARIVQPQFEARTVSKTYLARVTGIPDHETFECDQPITSAPGEAGLRGIARSNGLSAHTQFTVIRRFDDGTSLLEVNPATGRTNQIRIHLWHLGFPVVGDPAYLAEGKTGENRTLGMDEPTMCLHALSICLNDAVGEAREFQAPEPAWAK